MNRKAVRLAVIVALVPALGGCALLGIGRHEPRFAAVSTLPMGADAYVRFEEGRAALDGGNNAAAIAAFSEARLEPDLLGPSLNGMGVAWARLGRVDLAERYFRQAVAAAPQDARFAANLERAQWTRLAAHRDLVAPQPALAEVSTPSRTVLAGRGPVHLATAGSGAGARVAVTRPHQRLARIDAARVDLSTGVTDGQRAGPIVRVRLVEQPRNAAAYPVRVALAD